MRDPLLVKFENELSDLIDKYSGFELTNAEAIGVLEFAKYRIINNEVEDDEIS